jgi:hypothetical protein
VGALRRDDGALASAFAETPVETQTPQLEPAQVEIPEAPNDTQDTGVGPAPAETVALSVEIIATMAPNELRISRSGRPVSKTARR